MIRPRSAEIEVLSESFLKTFFSKWTCNPLNPDIGLDYKITIFEEGISTSNIFFVQLKATDSIKIAGDHIKFEYDVKHILSFLHLPVPVLFILYDAQNKCGYWINIQKYCREVLDIEDPNWKVERKNKTLSIPISNLLKDTNIVKNEIVQSSKEQLRYITDNYDWFEGYENILTDPNKLEEILNKKEIANIKGILHTSISFFQKGDPKKSNEQILKIYQQKRNDIYHLQAILGLITSSNPLDININQNLQNLSHEGLNLAKELKEEIYLKFFTFLTNYFEYFRILIQKLPIIHRLTEALKNEQDFDGYVKISLDLQNIELDLLLFIRFTKMQEILAFMIETKRIYEFLLLFTYWIQKDNLMNVFSKRELDESKMTKRFKTQEYIVKLIIKIAEIVEHDDISLHIHACIGNFYEVFGYDKGKEFYEKGLNLAIERKHQFYINLFREKLNNYGKEEPKYPTIDEMKDMPFSDMLQGLDFFNFSEIDSIPDPHFKKLMKIAKMDRDPTEILKKCENILIAYHPSQLGKEMGIHSLGIKIIMCSKHEIFNEVFNLMEGFKFFLRNVCDICEFNKPRSSDWFLTLKKLEEMNFEIEKIIKRKRNFK